MIADADIVCSAQDISSKQYHELTKLLKKSAGTGLKAAYRGSFLLDMATLWRTDVFTDPSMLSEVGPFSLVLRSALWPRLAQIPHLLTSSAPTQMTDLKLQRLVESAAKAASVDMVAAGMLTGSVAVAKTLKRDSDGSAVVAVNVCLRNARCAGGPLAVEAALLKSDLQACLQAHWSPVTPLGRVPFEPRVKDRPLRWRLAYWSRFKPASHLNSHPQPM